MSTAERSTPPRAPSRPPVDEDDLSTVPDHLIVALTVTDPDIVRDLKAEREASPLAWRDEVWDGVYVMSPEADIEHQFFGFDLMVALAEAVKLGGGGRVSPPVNISDRIEEWLSNFRIPDIVVFLPGNPAIMRKAHIRGGPDFAIEILSRGDLARQKLDFYAGVNTKEVLLIDRYPWALELYRWSEGRLALVGTSHPGQPEVLSSSTLSLTFRLMPGEDRPILEVAQANGDRVWLI